MVKLRTLGSLFFVMTATTQPLLGLAADNHGQTHAPAPVHGGIVVEASHLDLELVVRTDIVQLHLRDHGKALDLSKASAKLTLLSGDAKQEVTLAPVENRLEARGNFTTAPGTKAVAVARIPGRSPVTARFVLK